MKDHLTGLIWLKNANCFGVRTWAQALTDANTLAHGSCGLTDGSVAGDWRLPNVKELQSLIHFGFASSPALSNAAGTAIWTEGDPFSGVQEIEQLPAYWSSTSYADFPYYAWFVALYDGVTGADAKDGTRHVWPVRDRQ